MITPSKYFDVTNIALEYTAGRLAKRAWHWMRKRMILKWAESGWISDFFLPLFDGILKDVGSQRSLVWLREVSGPNLVSCYFLAWKLTCFPWLSPVDFRDPSSRRTGARDECELPPPGATAKWRSDSIGGTTRWAESAGESWWSRGDGQAVRLSGCLSKFIKAYPEKAMV